MDNKEKDLDYINAGSRENNKKEDKKFDLEEFRRRILWLKK